jgi:N-acetyl-D-muramate 6-phosphate phosphatase
MNNINCVLFDLDGTLADTSKDMCNALNVVLSRNRFKSVDCLELKTHISRGAVGVIEYASHVNERSIDSSLLRAEFLQEYSNKCFVHTKMIDDMKKLIDHMNKIQISWGIVTNKHSKYVNKILKGLSIDDKVACLITGDMVSEPKPSPEGLLEASKITGINPSECVYVGDDERDIIAGRNAGMYTVAADFGFIHKEDSADSWHADKVIKKPSELINLIV